MADRKVYHVTKNQQGGWNVGAENAKRASNNLPTKAEATERATELAKRAPLGQVKIHRGDGTFQTEHTYGKDPHPPDG